MDTGRQELLFLLVRSVLITRFVLTNVYILWVLFTHCTKGPPGPSLCYEFCSLNIQFSYIYTVSPPLVPPDEMCLKLISSCARLSHANILLRTKDAMLKLR